MQDAGLHSFMTWGRWRDGAPAFAVAAAFLVAAPTAGCAGPDATAGVEPVVARIIVKLVRGSDDGAAIANEATRVAGVPVDHAAAMSTAWHAIVLRCPSAAACAQAVARLQARSDVYAAVERDERMRPKAS